MSATWFVQRISHLSLENALEQSELKREGDKRDQPSNRERTYKKMAGQFGSNFCPEINKKLQLTLADEAILNGENLVKILTNQI